MNSDLANKLYTVEQVRGFDRFAIEETGIPGITLMRRAASACLESLLAAWPQVQSVVVYCGGGNNAGDGYIVAGMLADRGLEVQVQVVGKIESLSADAQMAKAYCEASSASIISFDEEINEGANTSGKADVIVDALLGIGVVGELRPRFATAIKQINSSPAKVLAVDIPSGINADTGNKMGIAVEADITVTFIGLKRGLFTSEGPEHTGKLVFSSLGDDLGVDFESVPAIECLSYEQLIKNLKPRFKHAHKNHFGHVLVVGGDSGMGGAVAMSAEAALRSGAGLVSVATHQSHASAILSRCPELMVKGIESEETLEEMLDKASVIVLGPGLGQSAWSKMIFEVCLKHIQANAVDKRFVIDADGLNLLAGRKVKNANWVLTPHPGEASRLCNHLSEDRFSNISELQSLYGGTVLLKGPGTLIQDENVMSLVPYGNPGMSTAGMGDVLSGVIAALLAQSLETKVAVNLATVVHSFAADKCALEDGERGLLATDLIKQIRR